MTQLFDIEYYKKTLPDGCSVEHEMKSLISRIREVYGDEFEKPLTPWSLVCEMFSKIEVKTGSCLVIGDYNFLHYAANYCEFSEIVFVPVAGWQEVLAKKLALKKENVKVLNVDYNNLIESTKKELGEMKFDVVVGNPPFSGKTSVHLKITGIIESHLKFDGYLMFILPKPILVRVSDRTQEYTSWLDTMETIYWTDIEMSLYFPTVGDNLVWFANKNNKLNKMVDISVKVPPSCKTWSAKYVTGLNYGECIKAPTDNHPVPVINCISKDGSPTFGKFTTEGSAARLIKGKPLLHVNGAGSMAARPEIAWLDVEGKFPYYRHYMETLVFDDVNDAIEAFDWIKSQEGKAYFKEWLSCGWGITVGLKQIIKPC